MTTKKIRIAASICMSLLAAGLNIGCSTGKAPIQDPGVNPITNGSLTWYVDGINGTLFGDGKTPQTAFLKIQQGADIALAGDTIEVADGTYTNDGGATLVISNTGSEGKPVTFTAAPNAHPLITGTHTYDIVHFNNTAQYVIFKGFTVMGDNASLTLEGAQMYGTDPGAHSEYNGNCINAPALNVAPGTANLVQPHHIQILNNVVFNCSAAAIGGNSDYLTISGNTIYNSVWYNAYGESAIDTGFTVDTNPSDTTTPYKVIITNNVIYNCISYIPWVQVGFISDGEAIIIDSNANSQYDPNSKNPPYTGRTLIANNVIYNTGSSAIQIYESAHVDIVNNTTYNNDINPYENTTMYNGPVTSPPTRGEIAIGDINNGRDTYDVNVYNNVMYSANNGIPLVLGSPCSTCNIDYNLYYGGTNSLSGKTNGPHDIVADPKFVDRTESDLSKVNLKLQSDSPAIGAGTPHLAPPTDINGNPRTAATGYTMGAYSQ